MIPKNHPRYDSLILREKIKKAYEQGYLADSGMIAHGRGETFDYILGEKTIEAAEDAMTAAVASLLLAKNPVISVNGNSLALAIDEIIEFANVIDAKIEINLFYRTPKRIAIIKELFLNKNYQEILGTDDEKEELLYIDNIESPRATASKDGIYSADIVLVALEDGDRGEILKNSGKDVIAIDLNPLSRTAQLSDIAIVDNIVRAIPKMTEIAIDLKEKDDSYLYNLHDCFSNVKNLKKIMDAIKNNLIQ